MQQKRSCTGRETMDDKLRRWLETRCRAQADGGWLVEVPVVRAAPAPAFVLRDGATKDAHLSRAVQAGRCRPAWMVVAEAAGLCAFAASVFVSSFAMRHDCRRAMKAWREGEAPAAPLLDDCVGAGSWFMLLLGGFLLAFVAATCWDWWRWNKGQA